MQGAEADRLIARVLAAQTGGVRLGPDAVTLLARAYAGRGDPATADAVGLAVAGALEEAASQAPWSPAPTEGRLDTASERSAWLTLFVDVASMSDDARLPEAILAVSSAIAAEWPQNDRLGTAMRSVDACLRAALVGAAPLAGRAVDELERLIGCAYRPGRGVLARCGGAVSGDLDDHVQTAAALLTAYSATGRLPYAMLADDLMQFARRSWWAEDAEAPAALPGVAAVAAAARVLVRLAAVHADPHYTRTAVVTEGYEHVVDAERILARAEAAAGHFGADACIHALAAEEAREARRLKIGDFRLQIEE